MKLDNLVRYERYEIKDEPYYEPVGTEVTDFEVYFRIKRPLSLVGPTGCGKTALATYMAYKLRQDLIAMGPKKGKKRAGRTKVAQFSKSEQQADGSIVLPYIEIPCHEDLTETHLVGRYGLDGEWLPGPLYIGASQGGIVLLDEIVEARKDAIVLLHSLTDDRRILPVAKKGEVVIPPDNFMVVTCYNPGYQVRSKNLKPSTRQRFPTIVMDYAPPELEKKIVIAKTGIDEETADKLVRLANEIRGAKKNDDLVLEEGASTRLLVMAAEYLLESEKMGLQPNLTLAARQNIFNPISNEDTDLAALELLLEGI